jgi:ABC-type Zn uptake system ZnuABC Zn-binding protein ZnuA
MDSAWRLTAVLRAAGIILAVLLLAPLIAACAAPESQPPLRVAATIAPLADWAQQVGQDRVAVTQIVPVGVDPETYAPDESALAALREADVILANGLGLEPWLPAAVAAAQPRDAVALELGQYLGPRPGRTQPRGMPSIVEEDLEAGILRAESAAPTGASAPYSPYLWLDLGLAQIGVTLIADTLIRVDPDQLVFYRRNAERYNGDLENLDGWVRRELEDWPRIRAGSRRIAALQASDRTWHHFAARYGLELRTPAELRTRAPVLPPDTPLFVNAFDARLADPSASRRPDGVLRPLDNAVYTQLIRDNVAILTRGAQRAAADRSRSWTQVFNDS